METLNTPFHVLVTNSTGFRSSSWNGVFTNYHWSLKYTFSMFERIFRIPFTFLTSVSSSRAGLSLLFPDGSPIRPVAPPINATGIWPHLHDRISRCSPQNEQSRTLNYCLTDSNKIGNISSQQLMHSVLLLSCHHVIKQIPNIFAFKEIFSFSTVLTT